MTGSGAAALRQLYGDGSSHPNSYSIPSEVTCSRYLKQHSIDPEFCAGVFTALAPARS